MDAIKQKKKMGFFKVLGNILKYVLILAVIGLTIYDFMFPGNTIIIDSLSFFDMEFLMLNSGLLEADILLIFQIFAGFLLIGDIISKLVKKASKKKNKAKLTQVKSLNVKPQIQEVQPGVENVITVSKEADVIPVVENKPAVKNRVLERMNKK